MEEGWGWGRAQSAYPQALAQPVTSLSLSCNFNLSSLISLHDVTATVTEEDTNENMIYERAKMLLFFPEY